MSNNFNALISDFQILLEELINSKPLQRDNLVGIPEKGIYVFYENGKPIYVGRSSRLKKRLQEHSRDSSDQYSATFVYKLAVKEANNRGLKIKGKYRKNKWEFLEKEGINDEIKEKVRNMEIRVIEIKNACVRMLFENFAAISLNTEHNDCEEY